MTTDPLRRYQAMMHDTHAPDHLSDQVLEQARTQTSATEARTPDAQHTATPIFTVKRTRYKGFAIAACTVLALGLGGAALALGPLSTPAGQDNAPAAASGNFFQMVAYADEGGMPAKGPITLSSEDFLPARSGVSYFFDTETGTTNTDIAETSRSYNLDLTCTGTNISSMTYEIQGDGVSFNNWQLTDEYIEYLTSDGEPGTKVMQADQESAFTVDYNNQDMATVDGVHHEICLAYMLDDAQKALFDELYAVPSHDKVPHDSVDEAALAALEAAARSKLDLALAQHDAEVISQAQLVLTATFTDGTTATKAYRLTPVDNFEQAYTEYLAAAYSTDGTTEPTYPALYQLEEIA